MGGSATSMSFSAVEEVLTEAPTVVDVGFEKSDIG